MEAHNYIKSGWVQQLQVRDLGDSHRVTVGNTSGAHASHSPCSVLKQICFVAAVVTLHKFFCAKELHRLQAPVASQNL